MAAQIGGVISPQYAASKAMMQGMTRYYARHLARGGITVNAIAPRNRNRHGDVNPNLRPDLIPVGRFRSVDEVADVGVMLARQKLHHRTDDPT